ncbi:MAG: type II toxin-antitoxin system VapB family antitoxin [Acidobacteriota bacterium]|jgi:antitoxin VapB
MPLNIKNAEVESLAAEVAAITGETKTEAIRRALRERRQRLSYHIVHHNREAELLKFLEREIWPAIPKKFLGHRLSRAEQDKILGFGSEGV